MIVDEYFGCLDEYFDTDEWGTDGETYWFSTRFSRWQVNMLSTGEILEVYPLLKCQYCGEWFDLVTHALHESRRK